MLKKSVLIVLLLLFSTIVIAQSNATNNSTNTNTGNTIEKAYQCLKSQVDSKSQDAISLQEAVFGVLALGSNQKLVSVIDGKIVNANHWADSSNQVKDTAQVLLAYNRINKNTDSIESWLLSNKRTATDLTWFLEVDVDSHESSSCTISYSGSRHNIDINEDMTLSGNPGSCLSIAAGSYWLRISNNCIDNNFTVSCDKDFTTSTLYQRTGSSTVFVSPTAHSTSALGTTIESVNSKCFSTSTTGCDYEGTLWAAIAMDKAGNDVSSYLPYLLALSDSNLRFLPSSFLHILTEGPDQYSQLVQSQQQSKFWQAPNTNYNRYYDSALALLSLQGANSIEESNSKAYLESIVTPEGCWNNNNLRDTGILLYSGWPRATSSSGGGSTTPSCESNGNSCTSVIACSGLGGNTVEGYSCPGTRVCCSESLVEQSCSEQSGKLCSSTQSCSGTTVQSTEGSCCLDTCNPLPQADECKQAGGNCYPSCNSGEEQLSYSCSESSNVCCKTKSDNSSSTTNWGLWITLLIILIVIVVVAIVMRNRLKMLLFKSRNKPGSSQSHQGPPPGGRPPFHPFRGPMPYPRAQPRVINPVMGQPIRRQAPSNRDKEMEETMRKLKEMGK